MHNPFHLLRECPERAGTVPRSHSLSGAELETQSASRPLDYLPGPLWRGGKRVWASRWSRSPGRTHSGERLYHKTPRTGPRYLGPREPWSSGSVDKTQTISLSRAPKSPDAPEAQSEEEVDELSLIDHNEIMARLTLKQEVGSSQAFVCRVWPRKRVGGFEQGTWRCPKQKGPSRVLTPPGGPPGRRALASRSSWATVGVLRPWAHG